MQATNLEVTYDNIYYTGLKLESIAYRTPVFTSR